MILQLKQDLNEQQMQWLIAWLEEKGVKSRFQIGSGTPTLRLAGDIDTLDFRLLEGIEIVENIQIISAPYKGVSRHAKAEDTVVSVGNAKIGGGNFLLIAGPCSVESEAQISEIACRVKQDGAGMLRGGAYKPRTSPYAFQGLGEDGLSLLLKAKEKSGLPIVTEIMDSEQLPSFEHVDVIQVGARNMQNYELLKKLGKQQKPILLKRGLSATIEELLMSAEYIMSGGNEQIILCERGIRTFETATRNTLDLSAVAVLKERTHLPIVVDPSHGTGIANLVAPMSLAATAAGADGLIIEVHNDPTNALCDGPQSITPDAFAMLAKQVYAIRNICKNEVAYAV
ncbi:MAG: 3-deoxy-7-phosphoheptulonate synthase [Christensenellaceae bacterium]